MLHWIRRTQRLQPIGRAAAALVAGVALMAPAAHVEAGSSDPVLERGDHSLQVVQLQQLLIASGASLRGGADGEFGPSTEAAVKDYQRGHGLPVNGTVDVPTATALGLLPATPVLAQGASGKAVRTLQRRLMAVGLSVKGGADGSYGAATAGAVARFQKAHGLPQSGSVDAATAAVLANAAAGTTTDSPATTQPGQLASFPVPATCKYWDTFGAPRSGGRAHQGVDIAAKSGTPIYAVQDGRISKQQKDSKASLAGNAIWLKMKDGTYYFYGHLSAFAEGVGLGSPVHAGDVIGYVGATGNAEIPHLHFEVHPWGGAAVNPYPILRAASDC